MTTINSNSDIVKETKKLLDTVDALMYKFKGSSNHEALMPDLWSFTGTLDKYIQSLTNFELSKGSLIILDTTGLRGASLMMVVKNYKNEKEVRMDLTNLKRLLLPFTNLGKDINSSNKFYPDASKLLAFDGRIPANRVMTGRWRRGKRD